MFNCDRPVFVFGCPRSGTSLLSRILNTHPRIGIPFESHFYTKFVPRLRRYGDLSVETNLRRLLADMLGTLHGWTSVPELEPTLAGVKHASLHGAVDGIVAAWCRHHGKPRWGEKTPYHARYWREISAAFPEAQFVHLIRDARDVAASWKRAPFGPKHLYVAARRWREFLLSMDEARGALGEARFYSLRYEDLIEAPERTIRDLCGFLGEDYAPEMLTYHRDSTPYFTDVRNLENLTRPLMRDNVYKWQKDMPKKDIMMIEAAAKDQLKAAGYPVTDDGARLNPAAGFFYTWILHPALRVKSMAANTKGQIEAIKDLRAFSRNRLSGSTRSTG
ncbi:MAG: sulfotransferase [Gammaproteobacteria bacterium]|nr:sulfotransferase [Gammaproteobacteria bacterium]